MNEPPLRHTSPACTVLLCIAAVVALGRAIGFWAETLGQPLVDQHYFRQTQTAITTMYLFREGSGLLDYQTPILGAPWTIPFEFPIYQAIVHEVWKLSGIDLTTSGRLVSLIFGIGCLGVGVLILRLFHISIAGLAVFTLLYLISPIYLYWNRTFMIESTALFFSLLALYFFWKARREGSRASRLLAFQLALGGSLLLALLTKATTALPVLLFLAVNEALGLWGKTSPRIKRPLRERLLAALPYLVILLIVLLILKGWISHADRLKSANFLGAQLASTAPGMARWNYGTPLQRVSPDLWDTVVQQRMLSRMALLPATVLLLGAVQQSRPNQPSRYLIACFLGLAVAPLLLFPNLHIVHNYYQSANQIYLLLAIAVAADALLGTGPPWPLITLAFVALCSAVFLADFRSTYLPVSAITRSDQQEIGTLLRERTDPAGVIYIEGDEYSSAIPFHAQRRAVMYPDFYKELISRTVLFEQLPQYLDGRPLEALVRRKEEIPSKDLAIACPGYSKKRMEMDTLWFVYTCPDRNVRVR